MDSSPLKLENIQLGTFDHWALKKHRKYNLKERDLGDDAETPSGSTKDLDMTLNKTKSLSAETTWMSCTSNYGVTDSVSGEQILSIDQINSLGYDCRERPYMTIILIVSIVILLILRKSSYIKNWVDNYDRQLKEQAALSEEEEGLMQRVF